MSTSTSATSTHAGSPGTKINPLVVVPALILAVLAFQLCASMVTPALPGMARALNASEGSIGQVSSLFFLASAVSGLYLSRWSDFIGRKKTFMIVMALLTIGTLMVLFATSLPMLLIGRAFQGFSGAAFQLAYVTLNETLSPQAFAKSLGFITAVNGGVGGLDGWWGGMLADNYGYKSIFWVILAVGLLAWVGVILFVPNTRPSDAGGRMDWGGATMLGLSLIAITYFLSEGPAKGWTSWPVLALAIAAITSFLAFVAVEKKVATPMFPIEHLASRAVWPVVATTLFALSSVFAVINFVLVLFSQNSAVGYGLDAGKSALLFLTPPALIGLAAAPLSGWLAGRLGWKRVCQIGLITAIVACGIIAANLSHQWVVFAMVCVLGVAYNGLILTTVNGMGVVQSPKEAPGALPGLNSAAFGVGASLGITLVAPIVSAGGRGDFVAALSILVGIAVLALITASLVRPMYTLGADAEQTQA